MKRIAVFASGTGSNATKLVTHFKFVAEMEISLIISNRKKAGVLTMAKEEAIPSIVLSRDQFEDGHELIDLLTRNAIDLIVLAGFLWKIPAYLVANYKRRIVNIHPALLPKFGGKGMYGMHVHRAVKEAGETESGITIHYVNEVYDDGEIIFQASCPIAKEDTPETIQKKVLALEHQHLSEVVESLLR